MIWVSKEEAMYENPKLERLGTFRDLTQDDDSSPCVLPIGLRPGSWGEDYEDDHVPCFSGA
jgi:hypothetical protein